MSTGEYFTFTVQFGGYKGDNGLPQLTECYCGCDARDSYCDVTGDLKKKNIQLGLETVL